MMNLTELWNSNEEQLWEEKLDNYWRMVKPMNIDLERKMNSLDYTLIKGMSPEAFYDFLYNEYFVWKYTAINRLCTTRMALQKYIQLNKINELSEIQKQLFTFSLWDIKKGLSIAKNIKGLGTAGASGLLSLLFPKYFGTVDQFVAFALS